MENNYPLWLEKISFLGIVALGIYLTSLLSAQLEGFVLWTTWTCGLIIVILLLTEFAGRIIQTIYTGRSISRAK